MRAKVAALTIGTLRHPLTALGALVRSQTTLSDRIRQRTYAVTLIICKQGFREGPSSALAIVEREECLRSPRLANGSIVKVPLRICLVHGETPRRPIKKP